MLLRVGMLEYTRMSLNLSVSRFVFISTIFIYFSLRLGTYTLPYVTFILKIVNIPPMKMKESSGRIIFITCLSDFHLDRTYSQSV